MGTLDIANVKRLLNEFDFKRLFIEELGWSSPSLSRMEEFEVQGIRLKRQQIAELSGVPVFEVCAKEVLLKALREKAHKEIAKLYHENLVIFVDPERNQSIWRWAKREDGKSSPREHVYMKGQPGDLFISKISAMVFDISQFEKGISIVHVAEAMRSALDVEPVTKKFYGEFTEKRLEFTELIHGITDPRDKKWYASILLNRLMFIYFLQRKSLLNKGDVRYLQNKLQECMNRFGSDNYYKRFLNPLFFEGFAKPQEKRSPENRELLGEIVYLNGGLFLPHKIEESHPDIQIPDKAFRNLFALFESYSWNLDDTPGGRDDEINPDVLGYIFEKYINQKEFGAYYTRPAITEYLCEHTIHQTILDKVNEAFGPPFHPSPKRYDTLPDLLLNLDADLCRRLFRDILPNLSILDPACGSGAFLVAAMKTLINIYSAVTGRIDYLSDSDLKTELQNIRGKHKSILYHIKREIITHNLFGVDIMEEACEIAKLRLFLALVASAHSVEELEPLPNIDFNILPGNSLIGYLRVEPNDFDRHARLGRDSYGELIRKREIAVKNYQDAQDYSSDLRTIRHDIEEMEREAAEALNEMLMDDFARLGVKFEQATWDERSGREGKPIRRAVTAEDIRELHPFHWGYEFNRVLHHRGGFDAIITNPPWETFKPQAKEFFDEYSELVTKNKMTIKEFEKEQARLLKDPAIREAWLEYLSRFPHVSAYFRSAPEYANQISIVNGKKAGTDINLYKLFTERCFRLLREGGLCGIVIPSGIYTDLGTKQLREMLFTQCRVTGLFCFENSKGIFEGVHRSFKFVTLTFEKGGRTESFPTAFMRHDVEELADFPRRGALDMGVETIRRLSPDSLSVTEFKDPLDFQIAEKMIRFPRLGEEVPGKWKLVLTREFDMTNNSYLFRTEPGPGRLPLYEGKMIHQFTHLWGQPKYWVDEAEGRAAILGRTPDTGQILDYQRYRLAFRDIASSTNERTLISTIIPPVFHGNKLPTAFTANPITCEIYLSHAEMLYLCALWNSFTVDYWIRQRVSSTLNFHFIYGIPIPHLSNGDTDFTPLVERAARLVCTTPEFDDLARAAASSLFPNSPSSPDPFPKNGEGEKGSQGESFSLPTREHIPPSPSLERGAGSEGRRMERIAPATDPEERAQLRAEIDAIVAHLYGLTREEFAHILSTFPLVEDGVKRAAMREFERME